MTPRQVTCGEVTVATYEVGEAHAPAVLLGHGVGSSAQFVLDAFAGPLVAAGWRLVAHDLRGHGASSPVRHPGGYHLDRLTEDVDALVRAVRPAVVGGVSLSGHAAAAWASRTEDAGGVEQVLACLPAWTGQATAGEGPHAGVAAAVRARGVTALIADFQADQTMHRWLRKVLIRDWSRHDVDSLAAALESLDGGSAPTITEIAGLTVPLRVVAWPDDPGHPIDVATRWAATAPRGSLTTLRLADLEETVERFGQAAARALAEPDA